MIAWKQFYGDVKKEAIPENTPTRPRGKPVDLTMHVAM